MFAILAALGFAIALILHLLAGPYGSLVTSFALGGLLCVALHLATGAAVPVAIRRRDG